MPSKQVIRYCVFCKEIDYEEACVDTSIWTSHVGQKLMHLIADIYYNVHKERKIAGFIYVHISVVWQVSAYQLVFLQDLKRKPNEILPPPPKKC